MGQRVRDSLLVTNAPGFALLSHENLLSFEVSMFVPFGLFFLHKDDRPLSVTVFLKWIFFSLARSLTYNHIACLVFDNGTQTHRQGIIIPITNMNCVKYAFLYS